MTYKDIKGYCDFHDFYESMLDHIPEGGKMVEVGCFKGHSVIYIASLAKQQARCVSIYAVDTFAGSPEHQKKGITDFYDEFLDNVVSCGVSNYIEPMKMTSEQASKCFADESLDFVFLDGAHDYESVKKDIEAWLPKVKVGGVLAGHDFCMQWPGVIKAVDEKFSTFEKLSKSVWKVTK